MPTEKITKLGNLLNSWTAVIIMVVTFFSGVFGLIYTIHSNSSEIENLKLTIKDNNTLVEREFEVYSTRSDKRYKRVLKEAEHLFNYVEKVEERQYELLKELYYLKGKVDSE